MHGSLLRSAEKKNKKVCLSKKKKRKIRKGDISVIWVVLKVLSLPSELNYKIQEPYEKLYP